MNLGHGGNVEEISRTYGIKEDEIIDFSANINPVGISKEVKKAMIEALEKIERYPDITYYELKKAIEEYENIDMDNIILGNGAAEVIFNIVRGLKPKKALLPAPTFAEYEDALKSIGCKVNHYKLKDDFNLYLDFIEEIKEGIDIVFICNPNNPTGVLTNREYILEVIKVANKNNTTVVIDESFLDFVEEKSNFSAISLVNEYKNLIVVKSLTKFFAFPGIRVGYGIISNIDYINSINNISIPWAINTVAAAGAITALKQKDYINKTIKYVNEEKDYLYSKLSEFRCLKVYRPSVNFIFFKDIIGVNLKENLLKFGILIRSCDNYVGLDKGYYRVAVRTREENDSLVEAFTRNSG